MTTPEGKIKKRVSALLKTYLPSLFYTMPVPGGYGESTLDYIGCYNGLFFAVETKAPGKKLTARQTMTANMIANAGGKVFVIDGDPGLLELYTWLEDNHAADIS